MHKKNRKYSDAFKLEVVRLSEDQARSIAEVAALLDIKPKKLAKWHAHYGHEGESEYPANVILRPGQDVRHLDEENEHLRLENKQKQNVLAFSTAAFKSASGVEEG